MDPLKVPKRRLDVTLVLLGGRERRVEMFLSDFSATHAGPERLSDLLNGPDEFLPVLDGTRASFVRRDAIMSARAGGDAERGTDDAILPVEHEVEIELDGGGALKGRLSYVLPDAYARVRDYLQGPERFLLLLDGPSVLLVNKRRIVQVTER